jgi:hypothetical protein
MGAIPHLCAGGAAFAGTNQIFNSSSRYLYVGNGAIVTADPFTVESRAQITFRSAGTLSSMSIRVTANSATFSTTVRSRINSANGAQATSIGAGLTGYFSDATNTDTVHAGDAVNLSLVSGSGSGSLTWVGHGTLFDAASNTVTRHTHTRASSAFVDATFCSLAGIDQNATEAAVQCLWRTAATLKNYAVNVQSNSRNGTTTVRVRKNGANGNGVISIGASSSGVFEDLVNTDTIADGDVVCWSIAVGGSSGNIVRDSLACDAETINGKAMLFGGGTYSPNFGSTKYATLVGDTNGNEYSATETDVQARILGTGPVTRLHAYVSVNSVNAASTVTLRRNTADATQVASITATTTGRFEDTTHEDTYTAGSDLTNIKFVTGGSSGSLTTGVVGMLWGPYDVEASRRNLLTGYTHEVTGSDNLMAGRNHTLVGSTSEVHGDGGTLTGERTALWSLDGSTHSYSGNGKFVIYGDLEVYGSVNLESTAFSTLLDGVVTAGGEVVVDSNGNIVYAGS